MPRVRALLTFLAGLLLTTASATATWSIVVVNVATGEVAVGIATCLTGFDLRPNTVVVVPGRGVAAAQSFVGPLSLRELIRDGFLNGETASQILLALAQADNSHNLRQYGIVSLTGGEVTFTGSGAGAWAGGVVGQSGDYRYAIQGNVLTGQPVVPSAASATTIASGANSASHWRQAPQGAVGVSASVRMATTVIGGPRAAPSASGPAALSVASLVERALRSAHRVRPKLALSTLQPLKRAPSASSTAAPTLKRE